MGRLEFTTPRDAWGGEATDFTPLLGEDEMLAYLGETLGLGHLTLIEREHSTAGRRSLDLLAETAAGDRVSIENQYGKADHDHLTRGLAYAVATNSRVLIVIAEDHGDEFVSVADYLNTLANLDPETSILVWLVQVRAVRRVGDDTWSPEFVIRAEPNEWEAGVAKSVAPNLKSLEDFYSKCVSTEAAQNAETVLDYWLKKPGASEGHSSQTVVGLYHVSPSKRGRGTNVAQLSIHGTFTVTRGFIRDTSGLYEPGAETPDLDQEIRQLLPEAKWTEAGHFITGEPAPAAIIEFLDWMEKRFNSALEG